MLTTDRLLLTSWQPQDWVEFHPIASDPEVMRYITGGVPWSEEETRGFVERQVMHHQRFSFCRWKVAGREGRRLLGFCGAELILLDGAAEIEIGWWLARPAWGKGLATEAASCALDDCLVRAGLKRVVSIAHPGNTASLRVMQKLGMRHERNSVYRGSPVVVYSFHNS
jgi:RimJ/RimL family protein N-acetyltransferase